MPGDSFVDMINGVKESTAEPASFGNGHAQRKKSIKDIQVRYFVAHMDDPGDQDFIEHLFTKALQCENSLNAPGDVCMFKEESNFDKTGAYTVVVKYAEYVDPSADPLEEPVRGRNSDPDSVEDFDV